MIRKYTTAAMIRNDTSALRKLPYLNCASPTVRVSELKSGSPPKAEISGVSRSATKDVTMAPNAAPMTTATARSMTFPCMRNFLNPLMITDGSESITVCVS